MRTGCAYFISLTALVVILGGSSAQAGGTFYMDPVPEERSCFGLSFMHWLPEGDIDQKDFDGTYDFYIDAVLTDRVNLRVKLPFSRISIPNIEHLHLPEPEYTGATIGNLYVGFTQHSRSSRNSITYYSAGVYFPTSGNTEYDSWVNSIAVMANVHQLVRVVPDVYTVYFNVASRNSSSDVTSFGVELGSQILIPKKTEGEEDRDTEVLIHYGLAAGLNLGAMAFRAELLGLAMMSEDFDDFEDRFEHHAAAGLTLKSEYIRPSVFYQVPLHDELKDVTKGVLGVRLEIAF